MAYELIGDVHTLRGAWKDALDQPLDLDRLTRIKAAYDLALRANVVYCQLCDEQHAAFLADLNTARASQRAEWENLGKKALCAALGYDYPTRMTTEDMIESALFTRISVENDHDRTKRIWSAMSAAEREGRAPVQGGLCWCITWHERGGKGECPDCYARQQRAA